MGKHIMDSKFTHLLSFLFGMMLGVEVFTRCLIVYHDDIDVDCAITYLERPNPADLIKQNCKK